MAEKKRREEVKARREANRKEALVVQKARRAVASAWRFARAHARRAPAPPQITNPKTLLKLNKKKAKKLVAVKAK